MGGKEMGVKGNYKYRGVDGMGREGGGVEVVGDGVFDGWYVYGSKGDEVIGLGMRILNDEG